MDEVLNCLFLALGVRVVRGRRDEVLDATRLFTWLRADREALRHPACVQATSGAVPELRRFMFLRVANYLLRFGL